MVYLRSQLTPFYLLYSPFNPMALIDYQRLYNVDQHLREIAAKKRDTRHIDHAMLTAYGDDGPHLLDKLEGYDYQLAEWLLHLDENNRAIFWSHPAFKL